MKLYLISQTINNGYDTYDSAVICAASELEARNTHPSGDGSDIRDNVWGGWVTKVEDVKAQYLGEADEGVSTGVVCASFGAG